MSMAAPSLPPLPLPDGVTSIYVESVNGLRMHCLSAGGATNSNSVSNDQNDDGDKKKKETTLVLLLHGFPELAYSWRKVMVPLAVDGGYHVVAPDQRGYGRTVGGSNDNLAEYRTLNRVGDMVALVNALGYSHCHVVGHDFGSTFAFWCASVRADIFRSVVMMSAPVSAPPAQLKVPPPLPLLPPSSHPPHPPLPPLPSPQRLPKSKSSSATSTTTLSQPTSSTTSATSRVAQLHQGLLDAGRQHYLVYYAQPYANSDLMAADDLSAFFRGYYHVKSADWLPNIEHVSARLKPLATTAAEFCKLPTYYVLKRGVSMPATVAEHWGGGGGGDARRLRQSRWLDDKAVAVYAAEYGRTGFQGGLNDYRNIFEAPFPGTAAYAGASLQVPSCFISGACDVGMVQSPGALHRTESAAGYKGTFLIPGAGHWVQQEQPEKVVARLLWFLGSVTHTGGKIKSRL